MANKRFAHYTTRAKFDTDLAANKITDDLIVFIKDTLEIWTHSQFYGKNELKVFPVNMDSTNEIVNNPEKYINKAYFSYNGNLYLIRNAFSASSGEKIVLCYGAIAIDEVLNTIVSALEIVDGYANLSEITLNNFVTVQILSQAEYDALSISDKNPKTFYLTT